MTDVTTLTPVEIDTFLAENWRVANQTFAWLHSLTEHIDSERERHVKRHGNDDGFEDGYYIKGYIERIEKYRAEISALRDAAKPYENEYVARGRWNRYFLVTNSNGHVHRGMNCSTCYPTTQYAWLVDLADCDESAMVDEYGTSACTVCFPDAPTLPAWKRHEEADAAAKAEKDAKVCFGTGEYSAQFGRLRYEPCSYCGAYVSITRGGKFRKHDRPKETV